jgi:formate--tetrahydrofolate ligase
VVLVATIRALKYHGGASLKNLKTPDPEAVRKGLPNLAKHIENIKKFKVPFVVAINVFATDSQEEIAAVKEQCREWGCLAVEADVWGKGGGGAIDLADAAAAVADGHHAPFHPMYDWSWDVERKIKAIASQIYGAEAVDYTSKAKQHLKKIADLGLEKLPVCIAKTQKSLSDNPDLLGRPKDFVVTVREIEIAAGAGFLVPITGDIMRMPGLPETPAAESIDIDNDGVIHGLF